MLRPRRSQLYVNVLGGGAGDVDFRYGRAVLVMGGMALERFFEGNRLLKGWFDGDQRLTLSRQKY
ncbi:hypothetical protein [Pseudomonas sp. R3-18-08]|uniref:hypothetical protein n=1 Tax=Pseudomonas sp. R3-18-08 TaxID=1173283 RepID=UPI000F58E29B|nr:hypothetical protein [Pseudomonas sp. R3-18-08]